MPTIYILLCESNKYYIGKTERQITDRIKEHFNGNGCEWTRKYKPLKLIEQIQNGDNFDEDKYTKKYMKKYGIDNVRGGTYAQVVLPEYSRLALKNELCTASNLCFRCNRSGHFINKCYATTKADGSSIYDEENSEGSSEESWEEVLSVENFSKEFTSKNNGGTKSEKKGSFLSKIFINTIKIAELVTKESTKRKVCFRCGRFGHFEDKCYASFDNTGRKYY